MRETLTWALVRQPATLTVPLLVKEALDKPSQARSQSLHTLSKIGDQAGWEAITDSILRDPEDEVAQAAWRAAVILAPEGERTRLAETLISQLSRGDEAIWISLSRAIVALKQYAKPALIRAMSNEDAKVREHAYATEYLMRNPEASFELALREARGLIELGG